jgi:hypothetical protein
MARTKARKVLCVIYVSIAAFALVATWRNMGPYIHDPLDPFVKFWAETRVTAACRVVAADLLMLALTEVYVSRARPGTSRFAQSLRTRSASAATAIAIHLEVTAGGSDDVAFR